MAELTPNLNLRKPQDADYVDVATDIAHNMDLLDAAFGSVSSGGGGGAFVTVASSGTDPTYAESATFVCDGDADQVEINAAIEVSNSTVGGAVLLLPGTFYLTDSIYPTGVFVGSGRYGTQLRWQAAVAGGSILIPSNGGIYVAHMALQVDTVGECLSSTGGDCLFAHLNFYSVDPDAVTVRLADNDVLRDSFLRSYGIGVEVPSGTAGAHVDHNTIWGYRTSVILYDADNCYITYNSLGGGGAGSDGTMPGEYSFYTDASGSGLVLIDSTRNVVMGNRVTALPGHGILLYNADGNQIVANAIESFGQRNPGTFTYSGIHLTSDSNDNTVQSNRVRSQTFINSKYGIRIDTGCYDNFVTDNDLAAAAGQGSPNAANNFSDAGIGTITTSANRAGLNKANRQTASYTLVLSDAGKVVEMNVASANNLTVPPNSEMAFSVGTVIEVMQYGAGQTTLVAGAGVTLRAPGGKLTFAAQYGTASLRKIATDEWAVDGDLGTSLIQDYTSEILADGPLIYLPLQDAAVGTPYQAIGSETLTLNSPGNVSIVNDGPMGGKAWRLSGAGASLQASAALSNYQTILYECWYRPQAGAVAYTFLSRANNGPLFLRTAGGQFQFHRSGLTILGQTNNNYVNGTHWYHVIGFTAADDLGGRFYIDGVNDSFRRDGYNLGNSSDPTYLFSAAGGDIAHIALYPTILSGARIAAHYAAAT